MIKVFSLLSLVLLLSFDAQGQRRSVGVSSIAECSSTVVLPNSAYIYKNSAPLRSGGVGTPLIGYRKEPTLIMNQNITRSGTVIYDSQGNRIGTCPWADAHGHAGGRFRCTMQTASLRRTAIRRTGSPKIFFRTRGTRCVEVPDSGRCYGSVKGLCNQIIR
jgi:hypothetical protein